MNKISFEAEVPNSLELPIAGVYLGKRGPAPVWHEKMFKCPSFSATLISGSRFLVEATLPEATGQNLSIALEFCDSDARTQVASSCSVSLAADPVLLCPAVLRASVRCYINPMPAGTDVLEFPAPIITAGTLRMQGLEKAAVVAASNAAPVIVIFEGVNCECKPCSLSVLLANLARTH